MSLSGTNRLVITRGEGAQTLNIQGHPTNILGSKLFTESNAFG